ncbi:MAG: PAS domain-containing sensor histidine kinase, partial [Calditrichaeota bacterium]
LNVTTNVIKDASGAIDSVVAVLKDLTEKKALEESLRRQEKLSAMGELASGVAHEIRNPLNSISMIAQRFQREFAPRERQEEFQDLTRAIVAESRRVNEIIHRFLAYARPAQLQRQPVQLNQIAREALTLVESEAAQKGILLKREFNENLPTLLLDPAQMKQAILNLLQNSLQAIERDGEIVVRTARRENSILLQIQDTGTGIAKEHLSKIFDLYFTTRESGTGMGLPIVHQVVTQHGGRIEVESEPGKGTTFTLKFETAGKEDAPTRIDPEPRETK